MALFGRRSPLPLTPWTAGLAAAGAALFVGAFFAGRALAPGAARQPGLAPAAARHARLGLQPLAQAAPLPALATTPAPQIRIRTVSTPAPAKKHRSSGPVEIVGSG